MEQYASLAGTILYCLLSVTEPERHMDVNNLPRVIWQWIETGNETRNFLIVKKLKKSKNVDSSDVFFAK